MTNDITYKTRQKRQARSDWLSLRSRRAIFQHNCECPGAETFDANTPTITHHFNPSARKSSGANPCVSARDRFAVCSDQLIARTQFGSFGLFWRDGSDHYTHGIERGAVTFAVRDTL